MTTRNWLLTVQNPNAPTASSGVQIAVVYGRTYQCAVGSTVTINGSDANAAQGQNLMLIAAVGPTASRPKVGDSDVPGPSSLQGLRYIDQTLGYEIVADEAGVWRNPSTGAAV
jgi:hypothetical protein